MANFRFSLQQVLEYREQLCKQAKVELAKLTTELLVTKKKVEMLQNDIVEQEARCKTIDINNTAERWLTENFVKSLREDLSKANTKVRGLEQAVEEAQKKVMHLAKEHKVLEKLKAKQEVRHAQHERKQEQKNYDETASIRFNNKSF